MKIAFALKCLCVSLLLSSCSTAGKAREDSYARGHLSRISAVEEFNSNSKQVQTSQELTAQDKPSAISLEASSPSSEDTQELDSFGHRWLYGRGLGTSMFNLSTTILFPPYAIYLLGNAGLEVAGLQTLYVTDALPEKPRNLALSFFDGVTSVPGRVAALVAGEEYQEAKPVSPGDAFQIVQTYAEQPTAR